MDAPTKTRPTLDDIKGAAERIKGSVIRTPMMLSRTLSEIADAEVWLKFENLSEDQVFAPLDRELLYFRGRTSADSFELRANNFLVGRDNPRQPVLVYDLALDGEWDPQGQSLGTFASPRLLEPGAELVTYVPTQPEGIEDLQGDLVWRVHIRKGYHPESGRGVTTLIDIAFHSSEIETQG